MKEAVGSTWIFIIVITLILFFTAFVSLSTNYTRTYKIKDEIISILTSKKGINKSAITTINKELVDLGYNSISTCPDDGSTWYAFSRSNDIGFVSKKKANYCIKKTELKEYPGRLPASYYSVAVFFKVDLPVIGDMFTLVVEGETSSIVLPNDGMLPKV